MLCPTNAEAVLPRSPKGLEFPRLFLPGIIQSSCWFISLILTWCWLGKNLPLLNRLSTSFIFTFCYFSYWRCEIAETERRHGKRSQVCWQERYRRNNFCTKPPPASTVGHRGRRNGILCCWESRTVKGSTDKSSLFLICSNKSYLCLICQNVAFYF